MKDLFGPLEYFPISNVVRDRGPENQFNREFFSLIISLGDNLEAMLPMISESWFYPLGNEIILK